MEVLEVVDYSFAGRDLENKVNFHSFDEDLGESPSRSSPNSSTPFVKRFANRSAAGIEALSIPIPIQSRDSGTSERVSSKFEQDSKRFSEASSVSRWDFVGIISAPH